MPPYSLPPILRLRVTPDAEDAFGGPRTTKSRRPHGEAKHAAVRRLIEQTTFSYAEIAARTGVARASICRWTRDGAWRRPPFAPRATDLIPRPRASRRLKLRLLAERLAALAERYVRTLEASDSVDAEALMAALQLLKMARLEAIGRRRRRRPRERTETGHDYFSRQEGLRAALREFRRGGVDVDRAPDEAIDLVVEARLPVEDHPALRRRGRCS